MLRSKSLHASEVENDADDELSNPSEIRQRRLTPHKGSFLSNTPSRFFTERRELRALRREVKASGLVKSKRIMERAQNAAPFKKT